MSPFRPSDPAVDAHAAPEVAGTLHGRDGARRPLAWVLASEAPVALLYGGRHFGVMMVTPRDLEDFARGFSWTEGIVADPADVVEVRVAESGQGVLVNVILRDGVADAAEARRRSILAGSACGICGAQTLEAAVPRPPRVAGTPPPLAAVRAALAQLAGRQPLRSRDRSTHAAGFADRGGDLIVVREDIGRHNALDKLAGALAVRGVSPAAGFVVLSGRISVEMVMKAARLGVPLVAAVSAPSDLALAKAAEAGMAVACVAGDDLAVFGGGDGSG